MLKLKELLKNTEVKWSTPYSGDEAITEVVADSRKVKPGCMFVCLKGTKKDGHDYIDEAVRRGAYAVLCSENCTVRPENTVVIGVNNTHSEYAKIMSVVCGEPDKRLKLIAVTGTNGKTTVTNMICSALEYLGKKTALIGTLGAYYDGVKSSIGTMTTPDPERLYPLLKSYADKGAEYAVMEASSHALALGKLDGLHFILSAMTNLTPEHLDFHGSMEEYAKAKSHLFRLSDKAVFCIDDSYTSGLASECPCPAYSCSVRDKDADFYADSPRLDGVNGISFTLCHRNINTSVRSDIPGTFTVSNALIACSVLSLLGFSDAEAAEGVYSLHGVKGRMEKLPIDKNFSVFIDFAHTPDALSKLLETVRAFRNPGQRIVTLFGCGGDRDPSKRSLMGAIASRLSDFVIVTADNSRTENTGDIIDEIMRGFDKKCPHVRIEDRRKAIYYAVQNAGKGDIILLCGKGHEEYEIDKSGMHPFSERETVYAACRVNQDDCT